MGRIEERMTEVGRFASSPVFDHADSVYGCGVGKYGGPTAEKNHDRSGDAEDCHSTIRSSILQTTGEYTRGLERKERVGGTSGQSRRLLSAAWDGSSVLVRRRRRSDDTGRKTAQRRDAPDGNIGGHKRYDGNDRAENGDAYRPQ